MGWVKAVPSVTVPPGWGGEDELTGRAGDDGDVCPRDDRQSAAGGLERVGPRRRRSGDVTACERSDPVGACERVGAAADGAATRASASDDIRLTPKVIPLVELVTVFPLASSTVTTGWVVNGVPSVTDPAGDVVKTSWVAVPAVIVNAELVAPVRPVVAAVGCNSLPCQ